MASGACRPALLPPLAPLGTARHPRPPARPRMLSIQHTLWVVVKLFSPPLPLPSVLLPQPTRPLPSSSQPAMRASRVALRAAESAKETVKAATAQDKGSIVPLVLITGATVS